MAVSLRTSLSYLKAKEQYITEKPYYFNGDLPPDQKHLRSNLEYEDVSGVTVTNIRGSEATFSLDQDGFELLRLPTKTNMSGPTWEDLPIADYLLEMVEVLKKMLRAELVLAYNYKLRRNDGAGDPSEANGENLRGVARSPHIDQTRDGGLRRITRHMNESEVEKYLGGNYRLRIINIWRPLFRKVTNAPLALCRRASVNPENLLSADRIVPEYTGEIYYLTFGEGQEWIWLGDQSPDEAWIFMSFDNQARDGYWGTPHASFDLEIPEGARGRESIEARFIVVSESRDEL